MRVFRSKWVIVWVLGVALTFRIAVGVLLGFDAPPDRAACGADTVEFELGAWNMAQGCGYVLWEGGEPSAFRAPGYPLFLAGLYKSFGRTYWVNRVALSLIGTLTCYVVYRLALALGFGRVVAVCAALVAALHPLQAYYSGHFMSEPVATFLNTVTTLLLVLGLGRGFGPRKARKTRKLGLMRSTADGLCCFEQKGTKGTKGLVGSAGGVSTTENTEGTEGDGGRVCALLFIFGAGVVNGLSTLVRPASLLMIPALGGLLLIWPKVRLRSAVYLSAVFALSSLLVVAPWTARNYRVLDRFCLVASNGGSTFWGANNAITADMGGENWGYWVSTGFDRETKQREVLVLANEVDRDRKEWELGKRFVRENVAKMPGLLLGKFYRVLSPFPKSHNRLFVLIVAASQCVMVPLVLMGLVRVRGRLKGVGMVAPVAQFLTLIGTVCVFYGSERFRVPYEAILAVFAGAGMAWILGLCWGSGFEQEEAERAEGD